MRYLNSFSGTSVPNQVSVSPVTFFYVGSYSDRNSVVYYSYTTRQITGINRPIKLEVSSSFTVGNLMYSIDNPQFLSDTDEDLTTGPKSLTVPFLDYTNPIIINPGQFLSFASNTDLDIIDCSIIDYYTVTNLFYPEVISYISLWNGCEQ